MDVLGGFIYIVLSFMILHRRNLLLPSISVPLLPSITVPPLPAFELFLFSRSAAAAAAAAADADDDVVDCDIMPMDMMLQPAASLFVEF